MLKCAAREFAVRDGKMGRSGEGKDRSRSVWGARLGRFCTGNASKKTGWAEEVETAEVEMGPSARGEKKSVCFRWVPFFRIIGCSTIPALLSLASLTPIPSRS